MFNDSCFLDLGEIATPEGSNQCWAVLRMRGIYPSVIILGTRVHLLVKISKTQIWYVYHSFQFKKKKGPNNMFHR
jgi:hypothetical protein